MIIDLIGGRVEFAFEPSMSILPMLKAGRVKLLRVASAKREALPPDVPTIAEQGVPGFQADVWLGLLVPKGTPPAIVQQLNAALNHVMQSGPWSPR
jgi:tripartite-type tricarboxylate transporter receptor subunit TctC